MTGELESAIRDLLKSVLLDVAREVLSPRPLDESKWSQMDASKEQMLLRSSEAAKLLDISERHLFAITRSGTLPVYMLAGWFGTVPKQSESGLGGPNQQWSPSEIQSQNAYS